VANIVKNAIFDFISRKFNKKSICIERPMVSRTVQIRGCSVPAIIHNMNYYFSDLNVYSDGLINCWEMTDIESFKKKLTTGWVNASIPDGEFLNIHHVGRVEVTRSQWLRNQDSLFSNVLDVIRSMNPNMENLFSCHGRGVEVINGVKYTWPQPGLQQAWKTELPWTPFSKSEYGAEVRAIALVDQVYYLIKIHVFKDDSVRIHGCPKHADYSFSEFMRLVNSTDFISSPSFGSKLIISDLGHLFVGEKSRFLDKASILGKIEEKRDQVYGRPGKVEECRRIFEVYRSSPTVENKEKLREIYESTPEHLRWYCGDMDSKDTGIKMALYGSGDFQK
jgi:hypothetical protein